MSYDNHLHDIDMHIRNVMRIATTYDHTTPNHVEIENIKSALTELTLAVSTLARIVRENVGQARATSVWLDKIERDAFTGADANKEEPQ